MLLKFNCSRLFDEAEICIPLLAGSQRLELDQLIEDPAKTESGLPVIIRVLNS